MFSQEEFDLCDNFARRCFFSIVSSVNGAKFFNMQDLYPDVKYIDFAADIACTVKGKHAFNFELEINKQWPYIKSYPSQNGYISFLWEKRTNWKKSEYTRDLPTHWVNFNSTGTAHILVLHKDIIDAIDANVTIRKNTKRGNRLFLCIPEDKVILNGLNTLFKINNSK